MYLKALSRTSKKGPLFHEFTRFPSVYSSFLSVFMQSRSFRLVIRVAFVGSATCGSFPQEHPHGIQGGEICPFHTTVLYGLSQNYTTNQY